MIVIAIIVLIVVPPEKLPGLMRDIGRFMGDLRRQTSGVWDEIKRDAAFNTQEYTPPPYVESSNELPPPESTVASSEAPLEQSAEEPVLVSEGEGQADVALTSEKKNNES
jgi:Sec-independent protein translocase protein TatA